MKRLVIAISIVALLGMFSPCFSILAQPIQVPHENPATAQSSLDKVALLLSYSKLSNFITIREYRDVQHLLNDIRRANIPSELRYITDWQNDLLQQLLTNLNNTEFLLNAASALFANNQISESKQMLDKVEANIRDAQLLTEDIETATYTLSSRLGLIAATSLVNAYAPPAEAPAATPAEVPPATPIAIAAAIRLNQEKVSEIFVR